MQIIIFFCVFFLMMFINYSYGKDNGVISKSYKIKQIPHPITFSIWAFIYIGLFVSIFYNKWTDYESIIFIISCVFNCLWLFFFSKRHRSLQLFSMIGLISSLCLIYYEIVRLGCIIDIVTFGVYLGWVSIALLLSILIFLKEYSLSETTLDIISGIYLIVAPISLYLGYESLYLLIPYVWTGLIELIYIFSKIDQKIT